MSIKIREWQVNLLKKTTSILVVMLLTGNAFSQKINTSVRVKIGESDFAFINKVKIVDLETGVPVLLEDRKYQIENPSQKATLEVKDDLIEGTLSVMEHISLKTDYIISNSLVVSYKNYERKQLTLEVYRDKEVIRYKGYYPNQTMRSEGWTSINKNEHFGNGISKTYYENGKLEKISNDITGLDTTYYPTGKIQYVTGPNFAEDYGKDGIIHTKQYFKNQLRYIEDYKAGKLNTRSYENAKKEEVKEYYKNGVLDGQEILKSINGSKRILTYNKTGKLIKNEPFEVAQDQL
ncbi:toxin-antitoxin system YwqK family antitoxin [Pedobacter caeni]|uniref:Antitoxin component YwqK of the YwqJK toxin-antitoxin module n=1 Tax=Pedobacter caeni TaxID=288992 RepID=A0A1M4WIM5_9SPHI|nr:hypothetical protein [Pedobacter caeni]SHE81141.1 Antitoxin component YwqK of the YwqJK toxin-antitoxin module [Pedobacter caeni]